MFKNNNIFLKALFLRAFFCLIALLSLFFVKNVFAYEFPGKPNGFINDYAGILNGDEKMGLETMLNKFSFQTGNQVSVAIIGSLGGDTIENYAEKLFKDWGIGQKDEDNGILLLVAIKDRSLRIEVGYGLEGILTDADGYKISNDLIFPQFKNGDYYSGIKNGILGIISKISPDLEAGYIGAEDSGLDKTFQNNNSFLKLLFNNPFYFFIFFSFFVQFLISVLGRSKSWWLGGVFGGAGGIILGLIYGFLYFGIISILILALIGFLFDYVVSKNYEKFKKTGDRRGVWFIGGGRGGGFGGGNGGGFGGFGGGRSGGGGFSGKW
ncbi:MAG: TPM domain-containing protein [Candidatus Pacebacteria bacterium]|nr:TPM domain-containing protein [Candidatus Paceibacterota bacterium]